MTPRTLPLSLLFESWIHATGDIHDFKTHSGLCGLASATDTTLDIHEVKVWTADDYDLLADLIPLAKAHYAGICIWIHNPTIGVILARYGFYNATLTPINGGKTLRGFMWRKGW